MAYMFDADGQRYIDYVGSWGPMILGHNNQVVLDATITAQRGLSFGHRPKSKSPWQRRSVSWYRLLKKYAW